MKEADFNKKFDDVDTDKDGKLTKSEFANSKDFSPWAANFDDWDIVDKATGKVSKADLLNWLKSLGLVAG
jgi:Ca2+-binding EF-hand superfamily protein